MGIRHLLRALVVASLIAAGLLAAAPADAHPYLNTNVSATGVFARYINLTAGRKYAFRTLTRAADPVMHLWGDYVELLPGLIVKQPTEVGFSDDYDTSPTSSFGSNARVVYAPTVTGTRVLLVRSFGGSTFGIGTVMMCEQSDSLADHSRFVSMFNLRPLLLAAVAVATCTLGVNDARSSVAAPVPIARPHIVRATRELKPAKAEPVSTTSGVEEPGALPPCVAHAYANLATRRDALFAEHGGDTPAFRTAYSKLKQSLVSRAALEAIGCAP